MQQPANNDHLYHHTVMVAWENLDYDDDGDDDNETSEAQNAEDEGKRSLDP